MYFQIIFSNGYCGCDEYIYIEAEDELSADKYAQDYLINGGYIWYDDASQCLDDIEDYDIEEEYWMDFEDYQANCGYDIEEITKEEFENYVGKGREEEHRI